MNEKQLNRIITDVGVTLSKNIHTISKAMPGMPKDKTVINVMSALRNNISAYSIHLHGQSIVIPSQNIQEVANQGFLGLRMDHYVQPFEETMIYFDTPLESPNGHQYKSLALNQTENGIIKDIPVWAISKNVQSRLQSQIDEILLLADDLQIEKMIKESVGERMNTEGTLTNVVFGLFPDDIGNLEHIIWLSDNPIGMICRTENEESISEASWLKKIAVACVNFLNCKNVNIAVGGSMKTRNRRDPKSGDAPEPFYICEIYDVLRTGAEPTGTGTKHGHIYDVRRHKRRLKDGSHTWVKAHQRGLSNMVYIPKNYAFVPSDGFEIALD